MSALKNSFIALILIFSAQQAFAWTCITQCKNAEGELEQMSSRSFSKRAAADRDLQRYCPKHKQTQTKCFNRGNPSGD